MPVTHEGGDRDPYGPPNNADVGQGLTSCLSSSLYDGSSPFVGANTNGVCNKEGRSLRSVVTRLPLGTKFDSVHAPPKLVVD